MKTEHEKHFEAMKKWNEQRAINEKKALELFWHRVTDPILHPSKLTNSKPIQK